MTAAEPSGNGFGVGGKRDFGSPVVFVPLLFPPPPPPPAFDVVWEVTEFIEDEIEVIDTKEESMRRFLGGDGSDIPPGF